MAAEDILIESSEIANELLTQTSSIGKWIQAIGLFVILWIIIQIINWLLNKKKIKAINSLKDDLIRIEKKVDKLAKKR